MAEGSFEPELESLKEGLATLKQDSNYSDAALSSISILLDQTTENIDRIKNLVDIIKEQIGEIE